MTLHGTDYGWDEGKETYEDFLARLPKEDQEALIDGKATVSNAAEGVARVEWLMSIRMAKDRDRQMFAWLTSLSHDELLQEEGGLKALANVVESLLENLNLHHTFLHLIEDIDLPKEKLDEIVKKSIGAILGLDEEDL